MTIKGSLRENQSDTHIKVIAVATLYLSKLEVPLWKVACTDLTSGKVTQVTFHGAVAENNRKHPKQIPMWIEGSFSFPGYKPTNEKPSFGYCTCCA